MNEYDTFLNSKSQLGGEHGFMPSSLPSALDDFQAHLVEWACVKGRSAIFADCGLGKTLMQLAWAEQVARHTDKPVLILTPLAVSYQTVKEGEKFGIECRRSSGEVRGRILITNYQRLHHFNPADFAGVVCDESSILKSFDGSLKGAITEFMKKLPYRLLCTATAAPNDYIELGTSSEALGELGYTDMLGRFFKNDQNTIKPTQYFHHGQNFQTIYEKNKWRFKGHAEQAFWRWVASWARAVRTPSDLGFDDRRYCLPGLHEVEHHVEAQSIADGMLFALSAVGLKEQREERRRTLEERCERVASLVNHTGQPAIVWCHLNDEGNRLAELIPDAIQVSGKDEDESKEDKLMKFANGKERVLITKPKIGAWGLNLQHCNHMTMFPSHSYEQYYQSVRRCWRFGQTRPVTVDQITTEGDREILKNMQRKATACDRMFDSLVREMQQATTIKTGQSFTQKERLPAWLC